MTEKLRLYDIDWDIDDEYIDGLPQELIIDNPYMDEWDMYSDEMNGETFIEMDLGGLIADYLSDTYGFCMFGFVIMPFDS